MKVKLILLGLCTLLLVTNVLATSIEVKLYDSDKNENLIFMPGQDMLIIADTSLDVENVNMVIKKEDGQITERMKIYSEGKYAYLYKISNDEKQGDHLISFIAKGNETMKTEIEFYVGHEIEFKLIENNIQKKEVVEENLNIEKKEGIDPNSKSYKLGNLMKRLFGE